MGLGGLTRDSIVGLNNLIKDDQEEPRITRRLSGSLTQGSEANKDQFLFLMDDPPTQNAQSASQSSFETSLNDGLVSKRAVTPKAVVPPTPYKVSATNSRSLDSYRTDNSDASSQTAYQGFNYEGYVDYYAESYSYDYPDYGSGSDDNILCCLFPWFSKNKPDDAENVDDLETENRDDPTSSSPDDISNTVEAIGPTSSSSVEESIVSPIEKAQQSPEETLTTAASYVSDHEKTSSPEKPSSPKDVQSSSDASEASTASSTSVDSPMPYSKICPDTKSVGVPEPSKSEEEKKEPPTRRGILKKRALSVIPSTIASSKQADDHSSKRHLFPSYSPSSESKEKKSINFNPMARVLTIASRRDFSLSHKCQVWWQKHDYDEFKKTGRIVSKAMECGGSEIWLASSNAWGKSQSRQNANKDKTWAKRDDSDEYNKALSKYVGEEKEDDDGDDDFGNKWWCKFGHSRRGLEHIASASEGKARQHSVLLSIRMTLEEQRRQRATRTKDPNKLRNVSMQYTSWARDLALAAGTADAEAVSSNFNNAAKSRAHHFAKQVRVNTDLYSADVGGGVAMAVTSQLLDANTHGGKQFGRRSLKDVKMDHESSEASLSKRAKGFIPGAHDEISAVSVLSGMGRA